MIDEKWIYEKPLPPLQRFRSWIHPGGDRPQVARRTMADKKFHIIVACNFRGDFLFHVFQPGETVNAERYINFVDKTLQLRRQNRLSIMHDNARPHTAFVTQRFFEEKGITLVTQPPYSPDFNLLDRYVFRNMEFCRRELELKSIPEVEAFLQEFLSQKLTRFKLARELHRLIDDLQAITANNGDYL